MSKSRKIPVNAPADWLHYALDADSWLLAYVALCDASVFPPLLFAPAHALELYLKAICKKNDQDFYPPHGGHNLWDLWDRANANSFAAFKPDDSLRSVSPVGSLPEALRLLRDEFSELYVALSCITDLKYGTTDWSKEKVEAISGQVPNIQWIELLRSFRIHLRWPVDPVFEIRWKQNLQLGCWRPRSTYCKLAMHTLLRPIGAPVPQFPRWIAMLNRLHISIQPRVSLICFKLGLRPPSRWRIR